VSAGPVAGGNRLRPADIALAILNSDEPLTRERYAWWVLRDAALRDEARAVRFHSESPAVTFAFERFLLQRQQVKGIRTRYSKEMRTRGRECTACGQHFNPRSIRVYRCPTCCVGGVR
jgi:hypothetical protein